MTEIVKYLPRVEPKTSSNAPYTMGVKKTKSKLSWGTDSPDAGSSTGICKRSETIAIAYQSRWYDRKTDKPYTIEIDGSMVFPSPCGVNIVGNETNTRDRSQTGSGSFRPLAG